MGCKAAETTHKVNNTLGPGTANERTVQWWFKKFCKGDEGLEDEECSGWPSEVDNDQLRASSKLILFFFLIFFYFLNLQYCIGFAIYHNESATGTHVFQKKKKKRISVL